MRSGGSESRIAELEFKGGADVTDEQRGSLAEVFIADMNEGRIGENPRLLILCNAFIRSLDRIAALKAYAWESITPKGHTQGCLCDDHWCVRRARLLKADAEMERQT